MAYVTDMGSPSGTAFEADELFRSSDVVVRRVPAGNDDRWVVTFDHYGIGHGFDRPGFGEAYLQAQGISAIHVMGRAEDWYQYADMDAALTAVRQAIAGATRVVTYGSSMGAYAALRFADAVGATDVLALSPQYSIDPQVAPHEDRWLQSIRRIQWRPEMNGPLACSARAVVVYDPTGADRWHGDRIRADIACEPVLLPHTFHPVTTYLSETGLLTPLITGVLDGSFDARTLRREARSARAASGIYMGQLAAAQPRRRAETALAIARHAVQVSPASYHAQASLSQLLIKEGRHDEALKVLDTLVQSSGRTLGYVIDYGEALLVAGRLSEALPIAEEVAARADGLAHLYAWCAYVHWMNGRAGKARSLIRKAARLDPGEDFYRRTVIDYHLGARRTDGGQGVRVTPWLRVARWLTHAPYQTGWGPAFSLTPLPAEPTSDGAGQPNG